MRCNRRSGRAARKGHAEGLGTRGACRRYACDRPLLTRRARPARGGHAAGGAARVAQDWLLPVPPFRQAQGGTAMLQWAIIFFVIALIAAVLGQRGVAGLSAQIGYLFVGVAVVFLVVAMLAGRGPAVVP